MSVEVSGPVEGARLTLGDFLVLPAVAAALPELAVEGDGSAVVTWVRELGPIPAVVEADAGELLLAGPSHVADATALAAVVVQLAEQRAAALCLALEGSGAVPPAVLAAAESAALPLVVLRGSANPGRICREAQSRVVRGSMASSDALLRDEHRLLVAASSAGQVEDVLSELARALDNPVALMSASGQLLTAAHPDRLPRDPFDSWPADGVAGLIRAETPDPSGSGRTVVAYPRGLPLPEHAAALLERGALLIGAVGAELPARGREAAARFDAMASIRSGDSPARRTARLRRAGLRVERGLVVPFVIRNHRDSFLEVEEWSDVAISIQDIWGGRAPLIVAHTDESSAHGLLVVRDAADRRAVDALAEIVGTVFENIELVPPHVVVGDAVAVDRASDELIAVAQAADVVALREERVLPGSWLAARTVELPRFLWTLRDSADARRFVDRTLGALVDDDRNQHLVGTLEVYCETLGQKASAARLLHLNRQTLYARLRRIEEVLRVDLDDPEVVLMLGLALRLRRG